MTNYNHIERNNKLWTEKILIIYWILFLISITGHMTGWIITVYFFPDYSEGFFLNLLIIPATIQLALMGITTYLIKIRGISNHILMTLTGTLLIYAVIVTHLEIPGLQILFILQMAAILVYLDQKKLTFSLYINLIAIMSLYLIPEMRNTITIYEFSCYVFVILGSYSIFRIVLSRANEVLDNLHHAIEKEQQLIVKSTMMERLTKIDPLTNLYNHKTFYEYLDFLYEQCVTSDMPVQLALIDIDNFKQVNDLHGHSNGDIVLKRVAQAISEKVTEEDIAARYGGEEFAVLLTNKSLESTYQILEELRHRIANEFHSELNNCITVSIGLKQLEKHFTKSEFFHETDELLYKAKHNGKNQTVCDQLTLAAVK
ncbi:GGDEF domain-containing protein [Gracilibacillus oryzae]|nr:GGDEF domain-containing protein [Gracilibacillus oryzae]